MAAGDNNILMALQTSRRAKNGTLGWLSLLGVLRLMWLLLDQRGYWEDCGRPGTSENDKTKEENIHTKMAYFSAESIRIKSPPSDWQLVAASSYCFVINSNLRQVLTVDELTPMYPVGQYTILAPPG
uniref:Uncharacterized protein n=1 Tax=Magallana gigas TaxID=29159 RepID=K1RWL7_MAGGI